MNPLVNQSQRPCIPLHCLYIYSREMNPPGQLIAEALHTTTLLIYVYIYMCVCMCYTGTLNDLVP